MTTLCQLLADWRGDLPPGGALASEKIDGFRMTYFRGVDGMPRLWSRNGVPLQGAAHIFARLQAMEREAGERLMFDGEAQVAGTLAATKHWFETGHKAGGNAGHFFAFDCITQAEWQAGGSTRPYWQRKAWLEELAAATAPIPAAAYEGATPDCWEWPAGSKGRIEPDPLSVLPDRWVLDADEALAYACEVWAAGGEGVVLKGHDSPYRRSRSSDWMKIKQDNRSKWERAAWRMVA